MVRALAFLLVLGATTAAQAAPCEATGAVVFQVDIKPDPAIAHRGFTTTRTYRMFAGGGWTASETSDGKTTEAHGCVGAAQVATVKTTLSNATWKVRANPAPCTITITTGLVTEYRVSGRLVFTARECGYADLDDASIRALDDTNRIAGPWPTKLPSAARATK